MGERIADDVGFLGPAKVFGYQWMTEIARKGRAYPRRTTIVEIGDHDFWSEGCGEDRCPCISDQEKSGLQEICGSEDRAGFEGREPLKGDSLAKALRAVADDGARTIVLDVNLNSPLGKGGEDFSSYSKENAELENAIGDLCSRHIPVVLGVLLRQLPSEQSYEIVPERLRTDGSRFNCVHYGYLELPRDIRKSPGELALAGGGEVESLSLATVQATDPLQADWLKSSKEKGFQFGRFIAAQDFGPHMDVHSDKSVTYLLPLSRVLNDPEGVREDIAGRIVLLGGHWHVRGRDQGGEYIDLHETPAGSMSGVFVHANFVEALADPNNSFSPIPDWLAIGIEVVLAIIFAVLGCIEIEVEKHKIKTKVLVEFLVLVCHGISILAVAVLLIVGLGIYNDFVSGWFLVALEGFLVGFVRVTKAAVSGTRHASRKENANAV